MIRGGFTTRPIIGVIACCLWWTGAYAQATDQVTYYHTDAVGSVRMVTDATGQVVQRHDYLPFGEELGTQPQNRRMFAGDERDQETGFDYVGARYYASQTGRFTSIDPGHVGGDIFNPQSWNAYAYALNNPLRFVDPLGTCSQDAKGNYVDGDDAGTLVASGPCPRGKDGALTLGVTETVSVKPVPSSALESTQPLFADSLLLQASNFSAGMGDALTGRMIPGVNTSLTEYVRNQLGTDSVVAKSSSSYGAGNLTGGTVGWTLAGSASATAAAFANGKRGALFGRGTQTVFNSSKIRFGWGWEGPANSGRDVIRLGIGQARGTSWWSHIPFWYP